MTSSPAGDANRGSPAHDGPASYTRGPDHDAASSAPVLRLQGVVMAVRGVTAATAMTSLRRQSLSLGTSVDALSAQVIGSVERHHAVITTQFLDALLAGHVPPRVQNATTAYPPGPERVQSRGGSVLHLIPTGAAAQTADTGQGWAWQAHGLTRRESHVLALIGQGLSNRDIAATLFVTGNTVKSYIRTAYQKVGVTRRAQAVRWAIEHETFLRFR